MYYTNSLSEGENMRQVIDGRIYDTSTAALLGQHEPHISRGDFSWLEEGLYQTPRGNFFLAGRGGPMSSYAEYVEGSSGRERRGGAGIRPLTPQEALAWAEDKLGADDIQALFPELVEEA